MTTRYAVLWIVIGATLGCVPHTDQPSTAAAPAPQTPPSTAAPPASASPATSVPAGDIAAPPASAAVPPTEAAAPSSAVPAQPAAPAIPITPAAPASPPTEQVKAKAGEGLKGQSLKNESGVIVEAAKAYFNVQQRVVFEMEIPKAMQLYKATEGRAPQTHDEFMSKIIALNNIKLPQLPTGNKYVYDPQKEELMVEKPARK